MQDIRIPDGYVLVPRDLYEALLMRIKAPAVTAQPRRQQHNRGVSAHTPVHDMTYSRIVNAVPINGTTIDVLSAEMGYSRDTVRIALKRAMQSNRIRREVHTGFGKPHIYYPVGAQS